MTRTLALIIGAILATAASAAAQGQPANRAVRVTAASGSPIEARGVEQLERLLTSYDLSR